MLSKAQTSTEYIIILSVILIISLMAITSMGRLPSIGNNADERQSQSFWQNADIGIVGAALTNDDTANDDIRIILSNNYPTVIQIEQINISDMYSDDTNVSIFSGTLELFPGEMSTQNASLNENNPCYGKESDVTYSVKIVIKFKDIETDGYFYYRGVGNSFAGNCAESI